MEKQHLLQHIEAMTEEQISLLGDLLNYSNGFYDAETFYRLCGITEEQKRKIDTAYPCDYAQSIREIYPEFNNGVHCFDYNGQPGFGSMRNLYNDFAKNLREKLKIDTL